MPPHLTFDVEKGVALGKGAVVLRIRNLFNDRYFVTFANAQGDHVALVAGDVAEEVGNAEAAFLVLAREREAATPYARLRWPIWCSSFGRRGCSRVPLSPLFDAD